MSRKKQQHDWKLPVTLSDYAEDRGINFHKFGQYHMRLSYDKIATLDCWTTRKYWIKETNYFHGIIERANETGILPAKKDKLYESLDQIFFAVEMQEAG